MVFMTRASSPVFLVGARASGKTTVGRQLAALLGWSFTDTDQALTRSTGMSVAELIRLRGWEDFRRQESVALRQAAGSRAVVATGGGMVLSEDNREFMRRCGTVFYLRVPAKTLAARLAADPEVGQRPALTGLAPDQEVEEVLRLREPLYHAAAHHVLDGVHPPGAVAAEAMAVLVRAGIVPC